MPQSSYVRYLPVSEEMKSKKVLVAAVVVAVLVVLCVVMVAVVIALGVELDEARRELQMSGTVPVPQGLQDPNCTLQPTPVPLPSSLPVEIQDALQTVEEQLAAMINTRTLPSITASVVYRDQRLWSKGFGSVDGPLGSGAEPDTSTIYRIGSSSKVFPPLMAYQLYQRGVVASLDDAVNAYCPGFQIMDPFNSDPENITLRQLMSHMSGLPREPPCGPSGVAPTNKYCPLTTSEIFARLRTESTSLILPPWTKPSYSNFGIALLGRCLEQAVGMTYEDYIQQNILDPLNMDSTGFNFTSSVIARMAYTPDHQGPQDEVGWWAPAGQMYSTVDDLDKLAQFYYSVAGVGVESTVAPEVLSKSLRKELLLPVFVNPDKLTGFGNPWEIRFQQNYTILIKAGNVGGYSALFSYVPDLHLGFNALFAQLSTDSITVARDAYDVLIPALVQALIPLQPKYPYPPDPAVYEGTYIGYLNGFEVSITVLTYQEQLLLSGFLGAYLAYREPLRFQVEYPDNLLPCLTSEGLAFKNEWVEFAPADVTGRSPSITIPGFISLLWPRVFNRV